MFRRVLVANRGEIAVRIVRTLREMGITSIAAFSDADRDALFVLQADEAYRLGPPPAAESYLNVGAILEVARLSKADAVHPGYGFLAENAEFAEAVTEAGMTFVGPSPAAIRLMGDKVRARRAVAAAGVPIVPGSAVAVRKLEQALELANGTGYPIAVKAAGGGGGRGIRVVEREADMAAAISQASREAGAHFRNHDVYIERYFVNPRHVEIQVLGDRLGHLVHFAERDCSIQRRHQKLMEETPSPISDRTLRAQMGEMAIKAAQSAGYDSVGTVEFLVTAEREFFFLEMNTRIQVEHPITEEVSGVDLIREMVLAASGEPISVQESVLEPRGHALQVRINAEDPRHGFRPTATPIAHYREPGGIGIRVDTGVYQGFAIPEQYDSLISKVVAWAPNREASRQRLLRALQEYQIEGPATTIPFAESVLRHPDFVEGAATTTFVTAHMAELEAASRELPASPQVNPSRSRGEERAFEVEVNRKLFRVRVAELRGDRVAQRARPASSRASASIRRDTTLVSPMHGTVIRIEKQPGEQIREGETLCIIEAMKMENEIAAHRSGTLASIDVSVGQTVDAGERLAVIE